SFTPQQEQVTQQIHEVRFFAVQAEIPGEGHSTFQYDWKINGRPVEGKEVLKFTDQPIGNYEIAVVVSSSSSDRSLTRRWTVEVQGVKENDDLGPIWGPRVEVFGTNSIVTTSDVPAVTLAGKVRNSDNTRSADNIAIWISLLDANRKEIFRQI